MPETAVLIAATFLVAFLYSSVGHGGASGYLAVLSLLAVPHPEKAASALCLNLLVAGVSAYSFFRAKYFSWKLTWPFLAASVPAAFAGGFLRVSPVLYDWLLAGVLLWAGVRLFLDPGADAMTPVYPVSLKVSLPAGGAIGLVSGIVGVGGGIFLSPLLVLSGWADPKTAAASSALFILVNSASGLCGRWFRGGLLLSSYLTVMTAAAFLGALAGASLGARRLSSRWLKRLLAVVLFLAAAKVLAG